MDSWCKSCSNVDEGINEQRERERSCGGQQSTSQYWIIRVNGESECVACAGVVWTACEACGWYGRNMKNVLSSCHHCNPTLHCSRHGLQQWWEGGMVRGAVGEMVRWLYMFVMVKSWCKSVCVCVWCIKVIQTTYTLWSFEEMLERISILMFLTSTLNLFLFTPLFNLIYVNNRDLICDFSHGFTWWKRAVVFVFTGWHMT